MCRYFIFRITKQSLVRDPNHFDFVPGYRSLYGPYLLTTYEWLWNDHLSGGYHLDYRERRGFGTGPDFNYRFWPVGRGARSAIIIRVIIVPASTRTPLAPISNNRDPHLLLL